VKQAREELLCILEGYIINKQDFSEQSIHNLMAASERQYQVRLSDTCTPTALLQDVLLRLQRSRHLDIGQKSKYISQVEQKIAEFQRSREEKPVGVGKTT